MKVSLSTAQGMANVDLAPNGVDELVRKIGAQLGAVEAVYDSGAKYDGVVVAKVMSCEKHPNADKLKVCQIDVGDDPQYSKFLIPNSKFVQVVCGAPNVRAGLTVAWLPPGSVVPNTYWGDKFVLEARELRGVVSNGMIASASELAISDDHQGILEIDDDLQPGTPFKTLYGLDDTTIEIENKMFTHRPDCFGVLGVAREIAGIQGLEFQSPDWYLEKPEFGEASELPLKVQNNLPELVPRFMAVAMSNIEIKPSPIWLQALLTRVAVKPINNVVDITNYLSYLTAQPLHAYDYDKVSEMSCDESAELIIKNAKTVDRVDLLNGKSIEFADPTILIATSMEPLGVGGVMGGKETEVDEGTKRIIIECASFDMYNIRKTSMKYGLFTDAVTRFNKGQSPLQNDRIIAEAMKMMSELAGAKQASNVMDSQHLEGKVSENRQSVHSQVTVSPEFINSRLGTSLTIQNIVTLLENVEFTVKKHTIQGSALESLEIEAPFWRTDIEIAEDVVEEVGRLLGFENLPLELPKRTVTPTRLDHKLIRKQDIRRKLASFGANEVLTYSFVHEGLLQKVGQNKDIAFRLTNALSPELQYYRLSLVPSLLGNVRANIKAGYDKFALFETGKVHSKTEIDEHGVPLEFDRVALVLAQNKAATPAYYQALEYLRRLAGRNVEVVPYNDELLGDHQLRRQMMKPFEPTRSAFVIVNDIVMGVVGEFKLGVIKNLKLPESTAGFEIFLSALMPTGSSAYTPLSRYPSTTQDICLESSKDTTHSELSAAFTAGLQENLASDMEVVTWPIDIYSPDQAADKKRITFRVKLTSYDRTLTEEVLTNLLDDVANKLGQTHHAVKI